MFSSIKMEKIHKKLQLAFVMNRISKMLEESNSVQENFDLALSITL